MFKLKEPKSIGPVVCGYKLRTVLVDYATKTIICTFKCMTEDGTTAGMEQVTLQDEEYNDFLIGKGTDYEKAYVCLEKIRGLAGSLE